MIVFVTNISNKVLVGWNVEESMGVESIIPGGSVVAGGVDATYSGSAGSPFSLRMGPGAGIGYKLSQHSRSGNSLPSVGQMNKSPTVTTNMVNTTTE